MTVIVRPVDDDDTKLTWSLATKGTVRPTGRIRRWDRQVDARMCVGVEIWLGGWRQERERGEYFCAD